MADNRAGAPPDGAPAHRHETDPSPLADEAAAGATPESSAPASDPRTTIAGRYAVDLQTPPKSAGIAVAYRGRDLRTRRAVVVKTLRLEYRDDPELRARFRREARLLQFLSHPNVIRALSFSEERGAPWLVLEQVPGRSLREEIAASAPLSPETVLPLMRGIAAGLDHLHARGLVHLDVRPENVVVTPDGDAKLVDFGVAQAAGTMQDPADGNVLNDVAYLAPEQVCGEPVTTATDVYALGCVVYELLTGQPPFPSDVSSEARTAAIRARLEQSPVPPTIVRSELPAWVDDVVLGALERDPQQRYGSAGSFAAMFHSGVEGDVDVETGRPRARQEPPRGRQVPVNEPGIAVKGSPRLASRRGEAAPAADGPAAPESGVLDAAFAPLSAKPISYAAPRRQSGLDVDAMSRWLWQAVILAAVLNVVLIVALLLTRGELPGVWTMGSEIGPGATVRIAGTGLVARAAPDAGAAIVADLPDGGAVRISGEQVAGSDGPWWPVEIDTATGTVSGYVPASWVQD